MNFINVEIQNADIVLVIDQRGVAKVLKHRTLPTNRVSAEVKLTWTPSPQTSVYQSEPQSTLDLAPEAEVAAARSPQGSVVYETPQGVSIALQEAAESRTEVLISGTKVHGDTYCNRRVLPAHVGSGYLNCHDPVADAGRSFRLDGITRVEVPR